MYWVPYGDQVFVYDQVIKSIKCWIVVDFQGGMHSSLCWRQQLQVFQFQGKFSQLFLLKIWLAVKSWSNVGQLIVSGEQQPLRDQWDRHRNEIIQQLGGRPEDSLRCFERQYVCTRSLGAHRAPTSNWWPFGLAWLCPSRPSGAQAVWPTQWCGHCTMG